jgi:hypothetical protein
VQPIFTTIGAQRRGASPEIHDDEQLSELDDRYNFSGAFQRRARRAPLSFTTDMHHRMENGRDVQLTRSGNGRDALPEVQRRHDPNLSEGDVQRRGSLSEIQQEIDRRLQTLHHREQQIRRSTRSPWGAARAASSSEGSDVGRGTVRGDLQSAFDQGDSYGRLAGRKRGSDHRPVQRSTVEDFTGDADAGSFEEAAFGNSVTERDHADDEFYSSTRVFLKTPSTARRTRSAVQVRRNRPKQTVGPMDRYLSNTRVTKQRFYRIIDNSFETCLLNWTATKGGKTERHTVFHSHQPRLRSINSTNIRVQP